MHLHQQESVLGNEISGPRNWEGGRQGKGAGLQGESRTVRLAVQVPCLQRMGRGASGSFYVAFQLSALFRLADGPAPWKRSTERGWLPEKSLLKSALIVYV